jgi:hypothetical protein
LGRYTFFNEEQPSNAQYEMNLILSGTSRYSNAVQLEKVPEQIFVIWGGKSIDSKEERRKNILNVDNQRIAR